MNHNDPARARGWHRFSDCARHGLSVHLWMPFSTNPAIAIDGGARIPFAFLRLLSVLVLWSAGAAAQHAKVEDARPAPSFDADERLAPPAVAFFAIGNWGLGGKDQRALAETMVKKWNADGAVAVLTTGDNFPESGVTGADDLKWAARFESIFPPDAFPIPFWATLGDDDYKSSPDAQVAYAARASSGSARTRWRMPARYWTTRFAADGDVFSVRVVGLDTRDFVSGDTARAGRQAAWLDSVLAARTEDWTVVLGYHPVFSNGMHGNTLGMLRRVKPLLEKHRVDLFLSGRDHDMQLIASVKGVRYIVSGGGSRPADTRWGENTVFASTNLGLLWFQMSASEMLVQFLDRDGSVVFAKRESRQAGP
ncbi:MAG: hypothetical protein IPP94_01780 [Ignavibacteria bacterium]|nr:hypothetical protein [Ignavibacteria bacterium]